MMTRFDIKGMKIYNLLPTQASANTVRLGLISGAEDITALGVQVY